MYIDESIILAFGRRDKSKHNYNKNYYILVKK